MMRISKKLLVFLFVASIFTACKDDDNTSFALQEISAPTNLSAVFDISQDDTGTVTITPTAVGASSFDVFFGDVEGETATVVSPGETISKVYGEGEFNLRIVAVGITGLTSELVRVVTISFTAPTELTATIAISDTNPFEVNVTPSATNATVYDVFFGLGADEVPVTIMSGETASYMYAEAGDYEVRIIARGAGSATIEISETITITGNAEPIVLPITFDDATVNYAFSTFNGASYEVVDNPDVSGVNADESKVGAITNSGAQFEGGAFTLGTPIDFSGANKTVSMKFWATSTVPVLLKFEGGVNGERQTEVVAQHGGTGWEILTFDFATDAIKSFIDGNQGVGEAFVPDGQYATIVIFVDGPGTTAGTFYLDDIAQTSGETSPLALPISFDDAAVNYDFGVFNGASYEVVDNPDPSGANATVSKVGAITNSGAQFEGGAFSLDTAVDFSTDKTITMKFWSTTSLPILLKFEGGVNGERENEVVATHGGTGWEELTFDFASNATKSFIDGNQGVGEAFVPDGQYATVVIFVDGPGTTAGTFYLDDIAQASGETSLLELPISFDDAAVNYNFGVFNGASYEVVDNPDPSGANATVSKVGAITNSGAQFEGGAFSLDTAVDFSTDKTITMKFWSTTSLPILLKFEGGVNGERENEVVATHGGTGWEELTFDFATDAIKSFIDGNQGVGEAFVPDGQYATVVIFVDGPGTTAGTFYLDDIVQSAGGGGGTGGVATSLPINFENNETLSGVFEAGDGVTGMPISNPDVSGINTSTTVYEFDKVNGAAWYSGIFQIFPSNIDFATNQVITFKIWSPKAGINVRVQLEKEGGGGGPTISVDNTLASSNEWVTINADFSGIINAADAYDKIVIFPDFDDVAQAPADGSIYYIDDIEQTMSSGGGTGGKTTFPVDFESGTAGAASQWNVFENVDNPALGIIANPDATGANTSATVAEFTARLGGQPFAGTETPLLTPFTLDASNSTVKIMVWKSVISDVGIKFANATGGSTGEIKVPNTLTNQWEELTFDFSGVIGDPNNTNIEFLVIFPDFDARTQDNVVYFDNVTLSGSGSGTSRVEIETIGFEAGETLSGVFEAGDGVTGGPIANPDSSGINTSSTVYEFNKVTGAAWYSGIFNIFNQDIDLTTKQIFNIKIWSPKANVNVRFQLEKEGGGGGATFSVDQTIVNANEWVTLTYDFSGVINAADAYDKIVIFPDFDDVNTPAGDGSIYYIDDITQQ